jgi:hypothetical protein
MATTIKNTVKLKKDEVFSLPAGAKVTSLIGGATSSCTTLPEAETLECYGAYYEIGDGENSNNELLLDNIEIIGIRIDNTEYLFTIPFFQNAAPGNYTVPFKTSIESNDMSKMTMFDVCNDYVADQSGQGTGYIATFKGIQSFYNSNAFFIANMQPGGGNLSSLGRIPFYLPIFKYSDILIKLNVTTTSCSCTSAN